MYRSRSSLASYESLIPSIITLINSTVGVAALAMPYCFQQCGILLSVVCLIGTAMVCIAACNIMIRLCLTHKGCTIEKACSRYLGAPGKIMAEISVIGLMIGFIIGFNVSLADLGSGIVNQVSNSLPSRNLRIVMLALLTVAITPLCLISRVQSLTKMSAFAMLFYLAMLLHMVFVLGTPQLFSSFPSLNWWRPAGVIQCLPIFFGSIFCQTQLLTIYTGLHQPSVSAMHDVVRFGVGIISIAYGLFGFMGYVAFARFDRVLGNVFLLYPGDRLSFCVQAGFLFTICVSIPLTLFPLRRSLDSFLYHQRHTSATELDFGNELEMPPKRFRLMTIFILVFCFSLSLTTDKIEVIIQLTSSLAGSLIGYILPSIAALSACGFTRSPKDRRVAICLLLVGISLFMIGLLSMSHHDSAPAVIPPINKSPGNLVPLDRAVHHADGIVPMSAANPVPLVTEPQKPDHIQPVYKTKVNIVKARFRVRNSKPSYGRKEVLRPPIPPELTPVVSENPSKPKTAVRADVNAAHSQDELSKGVEEKPIPLQVVEPKAPVEVNRLAPNEADKVEEAKLVVKSEKQQPIPAQLVQMDSPVEVDRVARLVPQEPVNKEGPTGKLVPDAPQKPIPVQGVESNPPVVVNDILPSEVNNPVNGPKGDTPLSETNGDAVKPSPEQSIRVDIPAVGKSVDQVAPGHPIQGVNLSMNQSSDPGRVIDPLIHLHNQSTATIDSKPTLKDQLRVETVDGAVSISESPNSALNTKVPAKSDAINLKHLNSSSTHIANQSSSESVRSVSNASLDVQSASGPGLKLKSHLSPMLEAVKRMKDAHTSVAPMPVPSVVMPLEPGARSQDTHPDTSIVNADLSHESQLGMDSETRKSHQNQSNRKDAQSVVQGESLADESAQHLDSL